MRRPTLDECKIEFYAARKGINHRELADENGVEAVHRLYNSVINALEAEFNEKYRRLEKSYLTLNDYIDGSLC